MSRGPGRIEREILAVLRAEAENAFTIRELCERIYREPLAKKHRVAVLRAAQSLARQADEFGLFVRQGVGAVIYNLASDRSRGMALAKLDGQRLLRRTRWSNNDGGSFEYRGKQHPVAATYHYRHLSTRELEEELRADGGAALFAKVSVSSSRRFKP